MTPYETPQAFRDLRSIKVRNAWSFFEVFLLGRFEIFGYRNLPSGKMRVFAAFIQTVWVSILLAVFFGFLLGVARKFGYPVNPNNGLMEQGVFATLFVVVATVFGATFWREQSDLYERWQYLAALFNQIVLTDPPEGREGYDKREHLWSCFAHDLLVMEMWAHKSFRGAFCDLMERSVIFDHNGDIENASAHLKSLAREGVDYSTVMRAV